MDLQEASAATDLLTLIGHAIECLQRSIVLFEGSEVEGGVESLGTVVGEIGQYLENAEEDPLLKLAALPPNHVKAGLMSVRSELLAVIQNMNPSVST